MNILTKFLYLHPNNNIKQIQGKTCKAVRAGIQYYIIEMSDSTNKSTGFYIGGKPKAPQSTTKDTSAKIEVKSNDKPATPAPRSYASRH